MPNQPSNLSQLISAATTASGTTAGPNTSPSTLSSKNDTRDQLRDLCRNNLYFLCKGVLGFKDFSPALHGLMCQRAADRTAKRQVQLWPRDHFKSSAFSIGMPLYEYINDPNVTILLAGSTATNASRRLRRIQIVFEKNKLFKWLFSDLIPGDFSKRWNEQEALCPRTEDRVEPTFDTIGVGGRVTGRHYMIKITDDMVDETCLDSAGFPSKVAMDAASQWFDYCEYLLESEHTSRDIVVGTRWAREDPYDRIMKDERYRVEIHAADGGCCPSHPAGLPIYPSNCYRCDTLGPHEGPAHKIMGFSLEYLSVLQRKDPVKYALQMRNNPVDPGITEFRKAWVQNFKWLEDGQAMLCGGKKVRLGECNTYLVIDPAFTRKAKNDPTGFLVGARSPQGYRLILDAFQSRMDPIELVDGIYSKWRQWRPYEVIVEEVAGAKFITPFLRERADRDGMYIRTRSVVPGGDKPKLARIRGLVGPYSRMEVFIAPGLVDFVNQLLEYPSSRDHLLDCQAMLESDGRTPYSYEEEGEMQDEEDRTLDGMSPITGY